jgi:tetratricopeptide (TPR) repeat protein
MVTRCTHSKQQIPGKEAACTVVLFVVLACSVSAEWLQRFESGLELFTQGQTSAAMEQVSASLQEAEAKTVPDSQLAMVVHLLGQIEYRMGRYRTSLRHFERVLRILPDSRSDRVIALADAAQACIGLGEFSRAQHLLRQALDLKPNDAKYWQLFGTALFLAGDLDEAEAAILHATSGLEARDSEVYSAAKGLLGAICFRRKQYPESLQALNAAISSLPAGGFRARIRANRATLQWKLGRKEEAYVELRDALAESTAALGPAHPDLVSILEDLCVVARQTGRKREASKISRRAAEIRSVFNLEANLSKHAVDWHDLR